ncbi:MAG: hypothetical protein ACD_19C00014G0046 [uncultured bacterium]|nr:MAG: hypothetical protein ACD_19C00014G0046 [uncultured bacterium]
MSNTKVQVINFPEAKALKDAFEFYESSEKTVYNSKPRIFKENGYTFTSTNDVLKELQKFGVSEDLSIKEAQFVLEKWYNDLLKNQTEIITEVPRPTEPEATTLTSDQFENFEKDVERIKESEEIRTSQKTETERFKKRGEEIFAEQQRKNQQQTTTETVKVRIDEINKEEKRIQTEIAAAEVVQEKFKDKVIYAKVVIPETVHLDEQEQKDLDMLREFAAANEDTRTKLINDLAVKIEGKIASSLEGFPEEQKILIARTEAVKIVEALAKPEVIIKENISAAILTAIHEDKTNVLPTVLQKDDVLLIVAKKGATLVALAERNQKTSSEILIENLFGPKLSTVINGPKNIQIILSEVQTTGQTTHQVNLHDLNQENINQLHHQESVLSSIKDYGQKYGYDKISGVFTNYARTYLQEKVASMPTGSILRKAYSSPITQSILARYGLANPVVLGAVGQSQFVSLAMKFTPETAGPLLSFAGKALGKEFVKPVVGLATKKIAGEVATQIAGQTAVKTGVLAGFGSLLAKGAAAVGVSLGVFTAGVSTAVTLAITAVGKMINWPKIKQWFRDNKAVFVGLGAGVGLLIGGPVAGLITGGLLMAATGTLGAFAFGAFNLFGIIGRSIGVAIATPVIVTLLVLPPLVAFIMLVINNSAYVVPPGPLYDISGNPNGGSIQFECTDEKGPVGIDGPNSTSPIANRAWKITFDLYQGFWCFWNRSPKAPTQYFPNDTLIYPDGYPELFDYEAFFSNPNNTPSSGNLFWCTYLVVKSYQDSGVDIPFELNSQSLFDKWPREKMLPNEATPDSVVPGSVIFFQVHGPGHPNRLNHVGIVYSVDQGGIVFVESNAGVKSQSVAFVSGKISRNIGDMEIKGFGLPN